MPVRFGPFEVDFDSAELRKHGVRLQLQDQPFRVLAALLERPGQVISREDLVASLWTDNTHVDFERGLNAAVTRLRQALSDSADAPKYIETIPKRGYRFIGVIEERVSEPGMSLETPAAPPPAEQPSRRLSRWLWVVVAGLAVSLTLYPNFTSRKRLTTTVDRTIPLPLTSYTGYERNGALSPDGRQLAFDWTDEDGRTWVYVKLVDSGEPVRLTSSSANEYDPVWSPDGRQIAFLRAESAGRHAVYVTAGIGGVERKIAEFAFPCKIDPSASIYSGLLNWSADGKDLLATGCEPERRSGLLLISVESAATRWLLPPPAQPETGDLQGSFSPDGRMLAFFRRTSLVRGDIYIAPFSSASKTVAPARKITDFDVMIAGITWTNDSKSIIFSAGDTSRQQLYRLSVEPLSDAVPLHWSGNAALQPSVSSTGTLVFTRRTADRNIWQLDLLSNSLSRLIASTELDTHPAWSPDGSRVAFTSKRSGTSQIWVCGADGTRCFQLTRQADGKLTEAAHWSPDGRYIAFQSDDAGNLDIYLISSSGGTSRRLTDDIAPDYEPCFSHNGEEVYFASKRSGRSEVWRISVEGGAPVHITRTGGGKPFISTDGSWLYFTRDGNLWRSSMRGNSAPQLVVESVDAETWALDRNSLWYRSRGSELRHRDLLSGKDTLVRRIPGWQSPNDRGMSVSPDSRYIIFTQNDNPGSDLAVASPAFLKAFL